MNTIIDKSRLINNGYSTDEEFKLSNKSGNICNTTVLFNNTKQDHGLFISRINPYDISSHILLSSIEETVIHSNIKYNLGAHRMHYGYNCSGMKYIAAADNGIVPSITYNAGTFELKKEIMLSAEDNLLVLKYSLSNSIHPVLMKIKPFLAFRNLKALSISTSEITIPYAHINNGFKTKMYPNYPYLYIQSSIKPELLDHPEWYYNFKYKATATETTPTEDLYVPCSLKIILGSDDSFIISIGLSEQNTESLNLLFEKEKIKLLSKACMKPYYE